MIKVETMLALYYEYQCEQYDIQIMNALLPKEHHSYNERDGSINTFHPTVNKLSNENAVKMREFIRGIISFLKLDVELFEYEKKHFTQRVRVSEIERMYKEIEHIIVPIITMYEEVLEWRKIAHGYSSKPIGSSDTKGMFFR